MSTTVYYDNNTHRLTLSGLTNLDDQVISDAAVTVVGTDEAGAELAGQTWPQTLDPDGVVPGLYTCSISEDLDVSANELVYFTVTAVKAQLTGEWILKARVKTRSV